jgi:hypothetical protein
MCIKNRNVLELPGLLFKFGWPMTQSCALLYFDRLYVTSCDAIWKMDGTQIQVSVLLLSIFFPWNFTLVEVLSCILCVLKIEMYSN